ncbi:hypothetical protein DFH07DRAFT_779157 [Mycena maculata]|uniref:Uncharacterized protein n=1 Tax=Mycena maculata TaxID=230809 RepID=A0AAD7MZQ1_9AGAR|nr:hypothetical protein DFH07DRAFT_779157 [Mycena maculata]
MSNSSLVAGPLLSVEVTVFNTFSFLGVIFLAATAYLSPTVHRRRVEPSFWIVSLSSSTDLCGPHLLYIHLSAVVYNKRKIRPALKKFLANFPLVVLVCVFIEVLVVFDKQWHNSSNGSVHFPVGEYVHHVSQYVWITIMLYHNWRSFWGSRVQGNQLFLTMFVRIVLFTIISMLRIRLSSLSIGSPNVPKPYWTQLVLTIVPIITAITFGSQAYIHLKERQDIMRSRIFWQEPVLPPTDTSNPEGDKDSDV